MEAEVQGQAETQPSVEEMAASVAKGMLEAEEQPQANKDRPRDESGKFTKPQEAQEAQEQSQETEATEDQQEETQEVDWDQLKSLKRKLTVKSEDGSDEEVELSLEEMEKGVMLERAFRMKTAQLARERESLQSKIKESVEPKLKEYEEKLAIAEQAIWHSLAPEIKNIDWNKLAQENPAEWAQKYQQVQNINAQLAHIQAERKKVEETRLSEQQASLKKQAEEAVEILKTEIPKWSNDLYGQILKNGIEKYGFKSEEVNAITDHRAIKVLYDAMQYQALKAKPIVEKRQTPQTPKVVKPGAGEKPDAGAEQWNQGMAKLKQSGRTEDAVSIAKMLLAREAKQK